MYIGSENVDQNQRAWIAALPVLGIGFCQFTLVLLLPARPEEKKTRREQFFKASINRGGMKQTKTVL